MIFLSFIKQLWDIKKSAHVDEIPVMDSFREIRPLIPE